MPILLDTAFLPPVSYLAHLASGQSVILDQHGHYQKGTFRNRALIATSHGLHRLSVPLRKGKNEQLPIREVQIAYDEPWQKLHVQTLRTAYGRAPFYPDYAPGLESILSRNYAFLFDLNWDLLVYLLAALRLQPEIHFSDQYFNTPPPGVADLRPLFHPKAHRRQADPAYVPMPYPQVFEEKHGFLPNLSVADLLFCMGPEAHSRLTLK